MTTRRERLERKLEKRAEWAEKATARSDALYHSNDRYRGDVAFNTQPGHIPERARAIRRTEKAFELSKLADHHEGKAAGLERQLDRSVFSDDDDAIAALEARIAEREGERDRYKAVNAAWKKAGKPRPEQPNLWRDISMALPEDHHAAACEGQKNLAICPYYDKPFPSYCFSNLSANIRRDQKRIEEIKRRQARAEKAEAAGGVLVAVSGEWCTVTFAEKPERAVIEALKAAGFHWSGGSWHGEAGKLPEGIEAEGGADGQ